MSNDLSVSSFVKQIEAFIRQNRKRIRNSAATPTSTATFLKKENIEIKKDISFLNDKIPDDGFLLLTNKAICCVRELTWHEKADIQAQAFASYGDELYYNELYEARKVIPACLYWVYDIEEDKIEEENLSKRITDEFAEEFWHVYQDYYEISAEEAGLLFNSAFQYFKNKDNGAIAVPSVVLEVDDLLHYVKLPYDVYMEMGCVKYQKYKIVLLARSHALFLRNGETPTLEQHENGDNTEQFDQYGGLPRWMFPPTN